MALNFRHWRLDSADTTALFGAHGDEVPSLIWFGDALPAKLDVSSIARMIDPPLGMAKGDQTVALSLFPQSACGLDAPAALAAHRNGAGFAHRLITHEVTGSERQLSIVLLDDIARIEVCIDVSLDAASGVASIATRLHNCADSALTVDWLASASLSLPAEYAECLYLHGRWGLEFQTCRSEIGPQGLVLQCLRGRSSHEHFPGVICGAAGFRQSSGDVIAATLAWSGSHRTQIARLADGRSCLQAGVALQAGELILAGGEHYSTPPLYFARADGMARASQSMHRYARRELLPAWTRKPRPVHANSWEALYFDHASDKLFELIDAAAAIGAERFVLDDGWFVGRRSDRAGLGDWRVDADIYPQGLQPVVDRVRAHGMQFGLWFEPEMVNPDSELYRRHPQWALHAADYETPLARNQLALNMDLAEVRDYLYEHIAALIEHYAIDYIKWDMNRDLVLAGDGQHNKMHRQPLGCYALMDRLNRQFPDLEIESCASGGARADWGILQYTGRVWTSDSIDALDRASIQRGYSLFCPPEIMGAHVGHEKAHLTGRNIDIHTRAIVALQGQFGYEVDARHLDKQEADTLAHYAGLYKRHRSWIAECDSWRLDSANPALLCSGLVAQDQTQSLWFCIAIASTAAAAPGTLFPTGLKPDGRYSVTLASRNLDVFGTFCKHLPAWMTEPLSAPGELLMKLGLTLPVMPVQSALLIDISEDRP